MLSSFLASVVTYLTVVLFSIYPVYSMERSGLNHLMPRNDATKLGNRMEKIKSMHAWEGFVYALDVRLFTVVCSFL